jgi:hypothetical protein
MLGGAHGAYEGDILAVRKRFPNNPRESALRKRRAKP